MSDIIVELCPETGICSIIKEGGGKVDLMPNEVESLRKAEGGSDQIKSQIANVDNSFSEQLSEDNIADIASKLK